MLPRRYSVIYFLTWNCNMNCTYCYETKHNSQNMSWDVARRGIDFFMNEYERVHFQFFGGEPLLQFNLMKSIADYLKLYYDNRFSLSIFTNGSLITEEVIEFFIKNNVFVTLSIDGSKNTQDLNRHLKNGRNSFDILEPILLLLVNRRIPLRIRMTVTPNNCDQLFENIKYFVENYKLMDIQEEIDRFIYWDENKIDILVNQYQKIIDYIVDKYRNDPNFSWKNYEKRVHPFIDQKGILRGARCGSSEGMCSIDTDGTLYPCQKFIVNQTLSIGDIYNGFNEIQREIVRSYVLPNYLEETRQCKNCEFVNYCFAGCIAENYLQDTNQEQDCKFRRLHKGMHKRFYDELKRNKISLRQYETYIDRQTKFRNNILVDSLGCGAEGCGMEGGCGGEGCGGEGCGAEGCGMEG